MKKTLIILAVVLGIACIVAGYIYLVTPANALPAYMPGYDPSMASPHVKHGIAAFVVGLALFAYAWFASAKKVS